MKGLLSLRFGLLCLIWGYTRCHHLRDTSFGGLLGGFELVADGNTLTGTVTAKLLAGLNGNVTAALASDGVPEYRTNVTFDCAQDVLSDPREYEQTHTDTATGALVQDYRITVTLTTTTYTWTMGQVERGSGA